MPGSLLLSNDAYSDVSEASGRSLDAKTGTKKVSFNNAVRVKQYPWKPDLELNKPEHLTLPSSRFWFKVYKSKQDSPALYNSVEDSFKPNSWAEENMECIHDSLAPIAEVEDQDLDSYHNQPGLRTPLNKQRNYDNESSDYFLTNNCNDSSYYHPVEPPVDYFDEMNLGSNHRFGNPKTVWRSDAMNEDRYNYNSHIMNSNSRNRNAYGTHGIVEESEENSLLDETDSSQRVLRLPRMTIQNGSPFRRSVRKFEDSDTLKKRERRSRSHDDYLDNDNRFKLLRKADKSVSTEDLNSTPNNGIISNRFLKGSRDMATQCYGTLNREKNVQSPGKASSLFNSQKNESERLNNFKPLSSSRINYNEGKFKGYNKTGQAKKETLEDDFSKRMRPYQDYQTRNNLLSSESNKRNDLPPNGKLNNGINRNLTRGENITSGPIQRQNGKTYKAQLPRPDIPTSTLSNGETRKSRENSQIKFSRDSATVGYLRGRQIPLSEVNTNTNRKFVSKNENGNTNRNRVFHKTNEKVNISTSPIRSVKSDSPTTNGIYSQKYSNLENRNGKNFKNGSHKVHNPVSSDGDNSMIDWGLSGFQLASKPDNGISVSDSEYTVHRRPPLLMYIPGVSHHDRPAVEDDRLSALSDASRSEINDGLSSLASSTKGKNLSSDIRRRHSMPRDGKLKWMKWKNKG